MTTVLLVDDDQSIRLATRAALEAGGLEVVAEGKNGEEGVTLYKSNSPDIVILDIDMPKKSGMEALREIMEHDDKACVIMFTSVSMMSVIDDCILFGASDYVRKDMSPSELAPRVLEIYAKKTAS